MVNSVDQAVTLACDVSGTADKTGRDYTPLPGSITIPAGDLSLPLDVAPNIYDHFWSGKRTATLSVGGIIITVRPVNDSKRTLLNSASTYRVRIRMSG
ncbi:MAG: hypothetical protein ABSG68_16550 [Thermoguttaceae bacterium]